ncbi:MAG: aldehyde dehydrogenase family protein, partial [Saccharospirillaceae bacterium]|nr:aldehyde dehydrogenase family protein [Pseudomonadales bacterium]NRB77898.1 aldehyde dehydrogenase family protein [Saccharospirillaceae bacterium]
MKSIEVINPFNQKVIAQLQLDDSELIQQKIDRNVNQFKQPLTVAQRKAGLLKWALLIEQQKSLIAGLITQEQGKPINEAHGEIDYALSYIHYYQNLIDDAFFEVKNPAPNVYESYRPFGICAFITPWNFPIAMLIRKVAPAIAAGNTVIAKPSELTPLSAKAIHKLFVQAFGVDGLFELTICDAELFSEMIMQDRRVRKISFTGSTRVGRLLIQQSADDIKRLSLELG